jgi:hypothetical protein
MPRTLTSSIGSRRIAYIAAISYILFFLVLFRFFRGFSVDSYGRLWHFFVSYSDFGMARRALIGTIVQGSHIGSLIGEYQLAYALHALTVGILAACLARLASTGIYKLRGFDALALFFSPALIVYQGYNTGSLDLYLIFLSVFVLFYSGRWQIPLTVLAVVLGCFIHEAFMFMAPFLLGVRLVDESRERPKRKLRLILLLLPAISMVLLGTYLTLVGQSAPDYEEYIRVISARIPISAAVKYPNWDGYFELYSSLRANTLERLVDLRAFASSAHLVILPLLYSLACSANFCYMASPRFGVGNSIILSAYSLFPTFILIGDFYRWVSLACVLSLLGCLRLWRESECRQPLWLSICLLFAIAFVSFGHVLSRPFPFWQAFFGV